MKSIALKCGLGTTVSDIGSSPGKSIRADRHKFEQLLNKDLEVKWNHHVTSADHGAGSLFIPFGNQPRLVAPFIVDASGVHSRVRDGLSIDSQMRVLPYVVYRGTRLLKGKATQQSYSKYLNDENILEKKVGEVLLQVYLNGGRDSSDPSISYVYSRPARSGQDPLHRPERPVDAARDIPQALYEEITKLQDLGEPFQWIFNVVAMKSDKILHWLMRSSLPARDELKEVSKLGAVFIGDSVHATPILGGLGANSAIQDAIQLAEHIAHHGTSNAKAGTFDGFYDGVYDRWQPEVRDSEERLKQMHTDDLR